MHLGTAAENDHCTSAGKGRLYLAWHSAHLGCDSITGPEMRRTASSRRWIHLKQAVSRLLATMLRLHRLPLAAHSPAPHPHTAPVPHSTYVDTTHSEEAPNLAGKCNHTVATEMRAGASSTATHASPAKHSRPSHSGSASVWHMSEPLPFATNE